MDYETKIYLDKLIEAVDNPDWWAIILTIINIAAFIFVAITQIRLQKQQTKLQELQIKLQDYDTNRSLCHLISSIHTFAMEFSMRIYSQIVMVGKLEEWSWVNLQREISTLKNELENKKIDIELKFPNEFRYCHKYEMLLVLTNAAIDNIVKIETQGFLNYPTEIKAQTMLDNVGKTDLIPLIGSYITEEDERTSLMDTLRCIETLGNIICEFDLLDKIKAKI